MLNHSSHCEAFPNQCQYLMELRTYPSPKPELALTYYQLYQLTMVGLGEDFVGSCSDTHSDAVFVGVKVVNCMV